MQPIGKGSKFLFKLDVNGLGELSLADNDVDFKVDFFARQTKDSQVKNYSSVKKGEAGKAFPTDDDDDAYFVVCDTKNLDLGNVGGTLTVWYTDEDTEARLKEIIPLTSQVVVIDSPQAPIVVDREVVQVVNDEQDLDESIEYESYPVFGVVNGEQNLFKFNGSNWTNDGPAVSDGLTVVNIFTHHVYVADAHDEWEDLGVVPYVVEN